MESVEYTIQLLVRMNQDEEAAQAWGQLRECAVPQLRQTLGSLLVWVKLRAAGISSPSLELDGPWGTDLLAVIEAFPVLREVFNTDGPHLEYSDQCDPELRTEFERWVSKYYNPVLDKRP